MTYGGKVPAANWGQRKTYNRYLILLVLIQKLKINCKVFKVRPRALGFLKICTANYRFFPRNSYCVRPSESLRERERPK